MANYLVPHKCCNVTRLPSWGCTHIQDPFSGTRPEDMTHDYRGKILQREIQR